MSGAVRAIPVSSLGAAPISGSNVHPGDIFYDNAGNAGIVTENGGVRGLTTVPAPYGAFNPALTSTPGAGGSGAVTVTGRVVNNGVAAPNALVNLIFNATGNLNNTAVGGTTQLRARVGQGTPNLQVTVLAEADGDFSVTVVGTPTQALSVTGYPVSPAGNASVADTTLP